MLHKPLLQKLICLKKSCISAGNSSQTFSSDSLRKTMKYISGVLPTSSFEERLIYRTGLLLPDMEHSLEMAG
jgi:hypothetical protein